MKKLMSVLAIIVLIGGAMTGCGTESDEIVFQGYGEEAVRFYTKEEYEAEFLKYVAGEDVDERLAAVARYMPEDYYLMPAGEFEQIEMYYDVMAVLSKEEGSFREVYWNAAKKKRELNERIKSMGGFNNRYTSENSFTIYVFSEVTVEGIEYIIERGFNGPKAIEYRESVGNPLTEEEIMYPREMNIYWEQDGALIEVIANKNKQITDDAELVSHYGKLQKVYYDTNDAAQGA